MYAGSAVVLGGYGYQPAISVVAPWTPTIGLAYQPWVPIGYPIYGGVLPLAAYGGIYRAPVGYSVVAY